MNTLNRRQLSLGLAASLLATPAARAANDAVEGKDYVKLSSPIPGSSPGKVEVIEFFGYWCPHCAAFEPTLEAWARKLPADVNFRRIPVAFSPSQESYQRLYFALEALGAVNAAHGKIFVANVEQVEVTLDIEREARAMIVKLDEMGGSLAAIETGFVQNEIGDAAYKAQRAISRHTSPARNEGIPNTTAGNQGVSDAPASWKTN